MPRDMTWVQLFIYADQPDLHYHSAINRGNDCEKWMPEHVKPIFRECESMEHACWTTLASRTCATQVREGLLEVDAGTREAHAQEG